MKWQVIILLMFLVACAKHAVEQKIETTEQAPMTKEEAVDISAAIKLGSPVKCVSEQEGQSATIYMKGSQMRMDTMPADAHAIYTSDAMYTWKGDKGMIMKMEDVKRMAGEAGHPARPKTQDELVAGAQQANTKCQSAVIDESMFVPPAGIEFQDMSALLKQAEAAMKAAQK